MEKDRWRPYCQHVEWIDFLHELQHDKVKLADVLAAERAISGADHQIGEATDDRNSFSFARLGRFRFNSDPQIISKVERKLNQVVGQQQNNLPTMRKFLGGISVPRLIPVRTPGLRGRVGAV